MVASFLEHIYLYVLACQCLSIAWNSKEIRDSVLSGYVSFLKHLAVVFSTSFQYRTPRPVLTGFIGYPYPFQGGLQAFFQKYARNYLSDPGKMLLEIEARIG